MRVKSVRISTLLGFFSIDLLGDVPPPIPMDIIITGYDRDNNFVEDYPTCNYYGHYYDGIAQRVRLSNIFKKVSFLTFKVH